MECVTAGGAAGFAFTARRNNSLSSSGRFLVFGFILSVSVGIALAFTWVFGAWLILPFAGLEMLGLYLAFHYIERHAADYERVVIQGDKLNVELRDGGRMTCFEFNRHWAQVVCTGDGSRLALRSHGRELEIGRHMNEEQRLAVARELKRELRGIR
ncbi:MAG: hypothetical protein A3F74_20445 [Betaproteobacteria bacterium RIFCSPLOWO2_12_FULL_62_58]|nr:MAG: hypothetical protein A3I62_05155 [Betaproteobacteria bacterium RIFCSPLOWO2_02_FULL_62_79]OGA48013.1 MAG: hypothetical protein A3F74_20445 [Betaproteobacteria bacterium RIFCSPLOWO2_12_FULL_62_58]